MAEQKKSQRDKNFEKIALYIAILLGMTHKTYEELAAVPEDLDKVVVKIHSDKDLLKKAMTDKRMPVKEMKAEAQEVVVPGIKYMRVVTSGEASVCEHCRPWQNRILTVDGNDPRYPSIDDYIASGAFHVNCKCSLQELDTDEIPIKEPNPRRPERAQARPDLYMNCSHASHKIIFT